MTAITALAQEIPIQIVGSSVYGRYNTVSSERTFNLFISDNWLVNFAGYQAIIDDPQRISGLGRGLFHSVRGNFLIVVIGPSVYKFERVTQGVPGRLLNPSTPIPGTGEVYIDENLSSQICIVNQDTQAYIYNWATEDFGPMAYSDDSQAPPTGFIYNYVTYQNTYFVFGNGLQTNAGSLWLIVQSAYNADDPTTALKVKFVQTPALQTKPDFALAALRIPGAGNNLIVFGSSVAELWQQVGSTSIYQRQASVNIDYGCASVATIAQSDNLVCWLGINERSAPSIMVMSGSQAQRISTDGIDYFLSTIQFPAQSTAFFYRQDGHLFYQLTFYNAADNATITYDFTTQKFFNLTDYKFDYHPARDIAYFNNETYFVSLTDARLYIMNSDITTYDNPSDDEPSTIPRVRVTDTFRLERPEKFMVDLFTFVIESGTTPGVTGQLQCYGSIITQDTEQQIYTEDGVPIVVEGGQCFVYKPRVDVSISKNGGITFSNEIPYYFHNTANYRAQPRFNRLGVCNQITFQLRFWSVGRVVCKNAVIEVRPQA